MISLCIVLIILLIVCGRLLLLVCSGIVCSSHSQPCTDPVSFNSTLFPFGGSCPNDTVLLVPVGDTVHYRCDYEDRKDGNDPAYWHITGLSGAFLEGVVNTT